MIFFRLVDWFVRALWTAKYSPGIPKRACADLWAITGGRTIRSVCGQSPIWLAKIYTDNNNTKICKNNRVLFICSMVSYPATWTVTPTFTMATTTWTCIALPASPWDLTAPATGSWDPQAGPGEGPGSCACNWEPLWPAPGRPLLLKFFIKWVNWAVVVIVRCNCFCCPVWCCSYICCFHSPIYSMLSLLNISLYGIISVLVCRVIAQ